MDPRWSLEKWDLTYISRCDHGLGRWRQYKVATAVPGLPQRSPYRARAAAVSELQVRQIHDDVPSAGRNGGPQHWRCLLGLARDLGIHAGIVERARDNRDDDRAGLGAAWARAGEVMSLAGRDRADDEPDDQQHRSDAHYYLRERQAGLDSDLGNGKVPAVPGRGLSCGVGHAALRGGSAPDAVLAGLQADGQACGADGAGPADCFGCVDLVQRGAIGRDRGKQLGILALACTRTAQRPAGAAERMPAVAERPHLAGGSAPAHRRAVTRRRTGPASARPTRCS